MSALPALGCASTTDGDDASATQDLGAGAGVRFTSAVGAVVVDGERLCTAALVDVDAEAHAGPVSLAGRQIVMGGACIGKLRRGMTGAAAFVVSRNNLSLATPILAIDFESEAAAGLAVGVLSNRPEDIRPMKLYGATGSITGAASTATVLRADENGVLVGAGVHVEAGADLAFTSRCSDLRFSAAAGATVAAGFGASDDGLGAAAIIEVNGELQFAASLDAGCVVRRLHGAIHRLASDTLRTCGELADQLAQAGQGEQIAVYEQKQRTQIVRVRINNPATTIQVGAFANVSARAIGVRTFDEHGPQNDTTCSMVAGQCELRPVRGGTGAPRGFTAGQYVDVEVTIHFGRSHVFIATKND